MLTDPEQVSCLQLIFNTSPLMTAMLASALLDAPPPLRLLPTLLLTIAGTGAPLWPLEDVDAPLAGNGSQEPISIQLAPAPAPMQLRFSQIHAGGGEPEGKVDHARCTTEHAMCAATR